MMGRALIDRNVAGHLRDVKVPSNLVLSEQRCVLRDGSGR